MSDLICPKCHGAMRSYERGGVVVDQCTDCRGLFLDRGELERLIDAETAWSGQRPPPADSRYAADDSRGQSPDYERRDDRYTRQQQGRPPKKRRSFFEELFD